MVRLGILNRAGSSCRFSAGEITLWPGIYQKMCCSGNSAPVTDARGHNPRVKLPFATVRSPSAVIGNGFNPGSRNVAKVS